MAHRTSPDPAAPRHHGRAMPAGGAVLGLGAVATLAAWSGPIGSNHNLSEMLGLTLDEGVSPSACSLGNTAERIIVSDFAEDEPFDGVSLQKIGEDTVTLPVNGSATMLSFEIELEADISAQGGSTDPMIWTFMPSQWIPNRET